MLFGKCVVTGGAGFIGSNLTRRLVDLAKEVVVIDNLSTGQIANLKDGINFVYGDIRDLELLKKVLNDTEIVFHLAALPSVKRSVEDPVSTNANNVQGTLNVLVAAKERYVDRVIFASSSSVYGNSDELPKHEDMTPKPISPYAVSKLAGEQYAKAFYDIYGLKTVILRYFCIFGPMQSPNSEYSAVIPKFIKKMLNDERPEIYGDGNQTRDFTYVDNVVEANILATKSEKAIGQVINIGSGEQHSLNELFSILSSLLGKNLRPIYHEFRKGDVRHSRASIKEARELLGYNVVIPFEVGLKKTIEYILSGRKEKTNNT